MRFFIVLLLLSLLFSCKSNKKHQITYEFLAKTEVIFKEGEIDFGELKAGEIVIRQVEFTNTGEFPFFVKEINSDCGCLQIRYPEKATNPGDTGRIEIEFNTSGLWGKQFKTIEIIANCKEPKHFAIFATVKNENIEYKY